MLCALVPGAARVVRLVNQTNPTLQMTQTTLRYVREAARDMGLQIHILNASTSSEIDAAFATFADVAGRGTHFSSSLDAFFHAAGVSQRFTWRRGAAWPT